MSYEQHVMALLEEGNPAVARDAASWSPIESDVYLATIERRSTDMTQLDTRPSATSKPGIRPILAMSAAAAAVILVVSAIFMTSQVDGDITTETVTGTTTVGAADVVGTWRSRTGVFFQISDDGTYGVALYLDGFDRAPLEFGTWELVGSEFVFRTSPDASACPGSVGRYIVATNGNGETTWTESEPADTCFDRASALGTGSVLPWSP